MILDLNLWKWVMGNRWNISMVGINIDANNRVLGNQ